MGGIVATSLLPHSHISAIITMSTPHTLPPARFDRRIDHIYDINRASLQSDMTPILSLCGGATDLMVPSESCILPQSQDSSREHLYRRTVFSSALEGSWTGVGHREMVWCHQVRWRVARAALELGAASSAAQRGVVLDTWLRDGHELPPGIPSLEHTLNLASENIEVLPPDFQLVIRNPPGSKTHLLPIPSSKSNPKFVLYVQGGSIPPTSPHNSLSLRVTPYLCSDAEAVSCSPLSPQVLKLLPAPIPGSPFPVPGEGTDESEGVVLFVGHVENVTGYVALRVEGGDGRGWVVGGFVEDEIVVNDAATKTPFISRVSTKLSRSSLRVQVTFPNFVSNALLVYRLDAKMAPDCSGEPIRPLLIHQVI